MSEKQRTDPDVFLQRELDAMAGEIPPMPRSFRNGWRQAIRQEAGTGNRAEGERPAADGISAKGEVHTRTQTDPGRPGPIAREPGGAAAASASRKAANPPEDAGPGGQPRENGPTEKSAGRIRRTRRWTGILSAAAVLVFLIGGTLLTRGTLSLRLRREPAAVEEGSGTVTVPSAAAPMEDREESGPVPAEPPEEAAGEVSNAAKPDVLRASEEEISNAADFDDASPALLSTEAPGAAAAGSAPAPANGILAFLEDMGAFVGAAWPWLAGAAAILTVGILIRGKRRKT